MCSIARQAAKHRPTWHSGSGSSPTCCTDRPGSRLPRSCWPPSCCPVPSAAGYGLTAAFIKGVTAQFNADGVGGVLTSWQLYACGAAGLISTWLLQNAYHAGTLAAAQPGITLADPVVATLWGTVAFGEQVRHGWILLPAALPLVAMTAGVLALSRSRAWQLNEDRLKVSHEPSHRSQAPLR